MGSLEPLFTDTPYKPAVHLAEPYPENTTFPLSLSPVRKAQLGSLTTEIKRLSQDGTIRRYLDKHGGIYFQNLGLENANEFSEFAHAFGWVPHEDIGNPVRRTVLAPNVATANEGPNTQPVYPHNEFGLSPHYPAFVLFYCVSAPTEGGETPINNSIILYQRLKEKHPEFIKNVEEKVCWILLPYPFGFWDTHFSTGRQVSALLP
jgi:hypothetical protein